METVSWNQQYDTQYFPDRFAHCTPAKLTDVSATEFEQLQDLEFQERAALMKKFETPAMERTRLVNLWMENLGNELPMECDVRVGNWFSLFFKDDPTKFSLVVHFDHLPVYYKKANHITKNPDESQIQDLYGYNPDPEYRHALFLKTAYAKRLVLSYEEWSAIQRKGTRVIAARYNPQYHWHHDTKQLLVIFEGMGDNDWNFWIHADELTPEQLSQAIECADAHMAKYVHWYENQKTGASKIHKAFRSGTSCNLVAVYASFEDNPNCYQQSFVEFFTEDHQKQIADYIAATKAAFMEG